MWLACSAVSRACTASLFARKQAACLTSCLHTSHGQSMQLSAASHLVDCLPSLSLLVLSAQRLKHTTMPCCHQADGARPCCPAACWRQLSHVPQKQQHPRLHLGRRGVNSAGACPQLCLVALSWPGHHKSPCLFACVLDVSWFAHKKHIYCKSQQCCPLACLQMGLGKTAQAICFLGECGKALSTLKCTA